MTMEDHILRDLRTHARKRTELRAYYKWVNAGRPEGMSDFFWQQALHEELWEAMQASLLRPEPAGSRRIGTH